MLTMYGLCGERDRFTDHLQVVVESLINWRACVWKGLFQ